MSETFQLITDNDFINVRGAASSAARLLEEMPKHLGYEVYLTDCKLSLMFYAGQLSYMKQVFAFGASVEQQSKLSDAVQKLTSYCRGSESREIALLALHVVVGM